MTILARSYKPILLIEATSISIGYNGTSKYLLPLINELISLSNVEVKLISKNTINSNLVTHSDIITEPNSFFARLPHLLWVIFFSGRLVNAANPDYYWSPVSVLPLFLHSRMQTIMTVHDLNYLLHPLTMPFKTFLVYKIFFLRSVRRASLIICNSYSTASKLTKKIVPSQMSVVRPTSGYQFSKLNGEYVRSFLRHHGLSDPYIFFVGSSEPRKNLALLINRHRRLFVEGKISFRLVVCTSYGWKSSSIKREISHSLRVRALSVFSNLTDHEVCSLMNGSQGTIIPSLYEGYGMPALHAVESGCRVYCSDTPELRESSYGQAYYFTPDQKGLDATLSCIEGAILRGVNGCTSTHQPLTIHTPQSEASHLNQLILSLPLSPDKQDTASLYEF